MLIPTPHPNFFQRLVHNVSSAALGAKLSSLTMHHFDRPILNATHGRFALSGLFTGLPLVMLTTTGAKSNQPRSIPLVAIPDGDKIFLIASNWGGANYPAWYHNLRAHPDATVTYQGTTRRYRAHQAEGREYETYWQRAVSAYKGYAAYKKRTNGRPIPIMVLEPLLS